MTNGETNNDTKGKPVERSSYQVRLPGFLIEEEIGLGDAVKRVTYVSSPAQAARSAPSS